MMKCKQFDVLPKTFKKNVFLLENFVFEKMSASLWENKKKTLLDDENFNEMWKKWCILICCYKFFFFLSRIQSLSVRICFSKMSGQLSCFLHVLHIFSIFNKTLFFFLKKKKILSICHVFYILLTILSHDQRFSF